MDIKLIAKLLLVKTQAKYRHGNRRRHYGNYVKGEASKAKRENPL
jgi:hypothetical protein